MALALRDLETLPSAVSNLARHKLRTLLTMLGIVFGVGAVISMLSIGAGAQADSSRTPSSATVPAARTMISRRSSRAVS